MMNVFVVVEICLCFALFIGNDDLTCLYAILVAVG